jgi:very-short-patch-repair endonuclease
MQRPEHITAHARRLRRDMTDAEKRLWSRLRMRQLNGLKFVRQEAVGKYIADFMCRYAKIIIELDGGQHADNERDVQRTAFLESRGYKILRFWNNDVLSNTEGVLESILAQVEKLPPHPDPLPVGERETQLNCLK